MSKVKIQGNASGTGIFTIAAPATNTDRTITLPDVDATVLTTAGGTIAGNLGVGSPDTSQTNRRFMVREDATDSSFKGIKVQNWGGSGAVAGLYLQAYDWVQGGIWHGRSASGTYRDGALVLGTNPDTSDLSESGLIGRLLIDNAGRIRTPYQPAFRAGNTAPDGDQSYGAQSKITHLNAAALNRGNCYDTANQRFIAPVAGVYMFIAHAWVLSGSTASLCVKVNGAFVSGGTGDSTTTNIASDQGQNAHHYSLLTYMNANDYAELWTRNVSMNVYKGHTWWQGYLIG